MPKKTAAGNRKKFLSDLRQNLLEMKNKLVAEIDSELKRSARQQGRGHGYL